MHAAYKELVSSLCKRERFDRRVAGARKDEMRSRLDVHLRPDKRGINFRSNLDLVDSLR